MKNRGERDKTEDLGSEKVAEESEEEGVKQENEVLVHHQRLQKEERENHRREHQLVSFRLSQNQENDDHPSIIALV